MLNGSQELTAESLCCASAPAMYCALNENTPAGRFGRTDEDADVPVTATPLWLVAVTVQSIELKNLNVTVPLTGNPRALPRLAVSYRPEPSGRCEPSGTTASFAALCRTVATVGVVLPTENGSQSE